MKGLDDDQIEKLELLFASWVQDQELPQPRVDQPETNYTGEVILPRVEDFTRNLGKDFLVVRGDGGVPPLPLTIDGLQFFPDVEIVSFTDRYISLEVKILRGGDFTGALTKALGQALIYRTLGVRESHVLLVDSRSTSQKIHDPLLEKWLESVKGLGIHVHWFSAAYGGGLECHGHRRATS